MKKSLILILVLFTACISARTVKILEVPSEIGAGTRGASLAPQAVEIAAMNAKSDFFHKHTITRIEPENQALYFHDYNSDAKNIEALTKVIERITEPVAQVMKEKNSFLVVIAGDHSTAAGTLAGMKQAFLKQRIGVIWIDAHADIHTPYTTPSGNMHGMPVAIAMGEDNYLKKKNRPTKETIAQWERLKELGGPDRNIQPSDIVYLAVRDTEPQEDFLLRKYSIKNYTVDDIRRRGIESIVSETMRRLRHCDVIYISFDVDSMDPGVSNGTGTPVANGLTEKEAEELLSEFCSSSKVRCLEFAEINPLLDQKNKMADISFQILNNVVQKIER